MENAVTQKETSTTLTRTDVYQQTTDIIIQQLEAGVIPWQQSWKGDNSLLGIPKNVISDLKYRGINIVLLWCAALKNEFTSSEWATFKQWNEKKEAIRKGEKGSLIVYYDTFEKEIDGETKKIPFLKSSIVFNRCQLSSHKKVIKTEIENNTLLVEKIDPIDEFIGNLDANIIHREGGACYSLSNDTVYMPYPDAFINTQTCTATEGYYSTLLHELTHWTGTKERLNRNSCKKFGDKNYANEELVAELGAAFMCADFGIATIEKGDHASYISHWVKVLQENKHCIITAASEATKAVTYLQRFQLERYP